MTVCNWIRCFQLARCIAVYCCLIDCGNVVSAEMNGAHKSSGQMLSSCCKVDEMYRANGSEIESVTVTTHQSCFCKFTSNLTQSNYGVWIRIHPIKMLSTDYVYVKPMNSTKYEILSNCYFKQFCSSLLKMPNITLYIYGHVRILLQFKSVSTNLESTRLDSCRFIEFDEVVICWTNNTLRSYRNITKCLFSCPSQCTCTLGDKSVTRHCPLSSTHVKQHRIFLAYPPNVLYLHLQFMNLTSITQDSFSSIRDNLKELSIWRNRLSALPLGVFHGLDHLQELELDNNEIGELEVGVFDGLRNLKKMFLFRNNLRNLPVGLFRELLNLTNLSVEYNQIDTLNDGVFDGLIKLTTLYLQGNNIISIDTFVFCDVPNLEILSLAGNLLSKVPHNLLADSSNMKNLNVSYNRLERLPAINHMRTLQILSVQGNPLHQTNMGSFDIPLDVTVFVDQPEICVCFVPYIQNCSSTMSTSQHLTCDRILSSTTLAVSIWIIAFCALVGNLCVLVWRTLQPGDEHKVQAFLISNLAMADLFMSIYMIIIASADVYYGNFFPMNAEIWRSSFLCGIAGAIAITSSEASILFLTVISIDRFSRIKFPHSARKLKESTTKVTVAAIWIVTIFIGGLSCILNTLHQSWYQSSNVCIGLPLLQSPVHVQKEISYKSTYHYVKDLETMNVSVIDRHEPGMFFSTAIFLGLNLLCFLVMLVCYADIVRLVHKAFAHKRQLQQTIQQHMRTTAKVAAIVLTNFICWFPIIVIGILVQAGLITVSASIFAWIVTLILPINSALNPFLYTLATILSNKQNRRQVELNRSRLDISEKRAQTVSTVLSYHVGLNEDVTSV